MVLYWEKLKINQDELNSVFEPNIITNWAIALCQVLLLQQKKYLPTLLLTESSLLFIGFLFCFPLNLIFLRKMELIANNSQGLLIIILITILLSGFILFIFNFYLWQKAKRIKLLSRLLEKIADYNNLINNFQLLAKINRLSSQNIDIAKNQITNNLQAIDELKEVLELTKTSLLNSVELESFIYNNPQVKQNSSSCYTVDRYQLLSSLEHNLADLALSEIDSNSEYQEILNEAVNLGLSVHQEVKKIRRL
mgnify:CR=1 FL=1